MVGCDVCLGLRPELVVVPSLDDLAAHAGDSPDSVHALHEAILGSRQGREATVLVMLSAHAGVGSGSSPSCASSETWS